MSVSQPDPVSLHTAPAEASPQAVGRLAGWRQRLGRVLTGLVGIVSTLEGVLIWVEPTPAAEEDKGGFSSRRAWAHLLRAASWIRAMRARLAEEGRAERAAQRAECERLGKPAPCRGRERRSGDNPRPAADEPKSDDCIAGRTDQEVMAQIDADLAVVARMLGDDDAARRLAIYQREAQALLGGPASALKAEAQRRVAARTVAAVRGRERRQWESAAPGAGAGSAAMAVRAPDSG